MKPIYRLLMPLSAIVALTLLAGCGPYSTNGTTNSTTPSTAIPSPVKTTKAIPTPRTTPTTPPRSLRTGPVTLNANASVYQPGNTIVLILNNRSGQTIHFPDHLTECTVVLLQHRVRGIWAPVAPCRLMILTRFLSLGAGQDLAVKLIVPSGHWAPGIYRGTLTYASGSSRRTIFSGDFQVV
jgi:hypothetical protein